MKTVHIGARPVGDGHPCFIVAEAGCNHNQKLDLAKQLVDMAVAANADAVKFQTYAAEEMYSKKTPMMKHFKDLMHAPDDATMFDLIKATELPYDMQPAIVEYCRKREIPFLSTPFGLRDVDILEELGVPAFKIASFEMTHFPLLRRVGQAGKPVILSTGMSTLGDIEKALNAIAQGGTSEVILLHCVSNYPAKPEHCNLRAIQTLKTTFGCPVGFSDHTPGIEVTKIAIAIGANMVEKHITVDQTLPGPDHYFSLTPDQLIALVQATREIEMVLGSPTKLCTADEEAMKRIGRRSLCAARHIGKGERVTEAMIAVKRPGTGIPTELMDIVIGAVAVRDIEADEPLSWDMFLQYSK
jgi:sialic acid synthase SpsE